jgi:hypothetical protein
MQITAEQAFEKTRRILTHAGYKIFTPSGRYNRITPALVAVRPAPRKLSMYLVKVHKGKLIVGWLQPDCHDRAVHKELLEKFKDVIKMRPRLISQFRLERWQKLEKLITPSERAEYRILIETTRLDKAG